MKSKRRALSALAIAAVSALAVPAGANGAYTAGQSPDGILDDSYGQCADACTVVQDVLSNEAMRVPAMVGADHGVVVAWKVRGRNGTARLRRLALDASFAATALGATAPVALTGATQEIPAQLPVRTGDALGIDLSDGSEIALGESGLGGNTLLVWFPPLADDAQLRSPDGEDVGYLGYQAVIEPDADADGLGDETQDPCVACDPGGGGDPGPTDPPPGGPGPGDQPPVDPYAAVRQSGPKVAIAAKAKAAKGVVSLSARNPYAFPITGRVALKSGRKTVGRATLKLAADGARTVKLRVSRATARQLARRRKLKLIAVATMKAPVGKARSTTRKLTVSLAAKPKPSKPRKPTGGGDSGIDGRYVGSGATAGWVMVVEGGIVETFYGDATLFCSNTSKQEKRGFSMVGDDPPPKVGGDGSFAWEATANYGFQKLKFKGRISKQGTATGNAVIEYRPMITGVSPVTGLPRIEFDYCFVGQDFTLKKQ